IPKLAKNARDVRAGRVLGERGFRDPVQLVPPLSGTVHHGLRDDGSGHASSATLIEGLPSVLSSTTTESSRKSSALRRSGFERAARTPASEAAPLGPE